MSVESNTFTNPFKKKQNKKRDLRAHSAATHVHGVERGPFEAPPKERIMTRRVVTSCLLLIFSLPALAADDGNVMYVGGTAASMKDGTVGKLGMKSQTDLTFASPAGRLAIPFAKIDFYEHSEKVAHHLGVLPAIAVGLLKIRQKKHFLRIAYRDEDNASQVAVFEVPKKMPRTLLAILQQRAPQGCKPAAYERCRVSQM